MTNPRTIEEKCAEKLFEIIPRIMQMIRQEVRAGSGAGSKAAITVPQFRTLHHLARNASNSTNRSGTNNGELAEWMGISIPAMSKMIDILVKGGLIQRQRGRTDRRQIKLSLTAKGQQISDTSRTKARQMFAKKLKNIPQDKQEMLLEGFEILQNYFIKSEENSHENANFNAGDSSRVERVRTPANFRR